MSKPILTTSKMPTETEQQYSAWLLYSEAGSLTKLHRMWEGLHQGFIDSSSEIEGIRGRLGMPPTLRTLAEWSRKFRWVDRCDLKLAEDLEGIRKKTQEIKQKQVGFIAEALWDKLRSLRKQIKNGEVATVDEIKKLWEMFRTEMGESLGKHQFDIREEDQKPPTGEEMAGIENISREFKDFYEQRRRSGKEIGNLLDRKKQDKK